MPRLKWCFLGEPMGPTLGYFLVSISVLGYSASSVLGARELITIIVNGGKRVINGPRREKTCLRGFANKTGADQISIRAV